MKGVNGDKYIFKYLKNHAFCRHGNQYISMYFKINGKQQKVFSDKMNMNKIWSPLVLYHIKKRFNILLHEFEIFQSTQSE